MSEPPGDDPSRYLRTELLERIAHEVRGPAGVVLGALDELEHALDPELVEQNRTLFAMARRGARRVLRTAERLSRTASLEASPAPVQRVSSDVRGVVRDAVQEAEQAEGRASIQLKVSLPAEPCACEIDPGWLAVALAELVAQAIRTARRQVEVAVERLSGSVRVSVSDDRAVLTEAPVERFVPLEDRRDAGLGWPLIWDVVRAHQAELSSEPLRGPTGAIQGFRIALALRAE